MIRFSTQNSVFTAPGAAVHIASFSYTRTSIQPADNPVEHGINSYQLLLVTMAKKTEAVSAYLINNNKEKREERRKTGAL